MGRHVNRADALAYAGWAGKDLPTEEEWEYAARGGIAGATHVWAEQFMPGGKVMANTWHGRFPWENLNPPGDRRTVPVRQFPPNGYGLYDVAGKVWEWTRSSWTEESHDAAGTPRPACCSPQVERLVETDRRVGQGRVPYLCAPTYCHRVTGAAARQGHIGTRQSGTSVRGAPAQRPQPEGAAPEHRNPMCPSCCVRVTRRAARRYRWQ